MRRYHIEISKEMDTVAVWEKRVANAFAQDEFVVMYQPKFDLHTYQIIGAEALVRWVRSDGTMISPVEFIPMFEEGGYIEALDFLVLEKTCQMLSKVQQKGEKPFPVSVNFSRLHIFNPIFVETLHKIVQSYNLAAELIEIEFTESVFIHDVPPLDQVIEQLHTYGYTIALDDFGAGFSTLHNLMNLQVDVLKLDRAFLKLTNDNKQRAQCVIASLVQMANILGIQVVAEGIENRLAVELLRQCGCKVGQGYYYSKPITEAEYMGRICKKNMAV